MSGIAGGGGGEAVVGTREELGVVDGKEDGGCWYKTKARWRVRSAGAIVSVGEKL